MQRDHKFFDQWARNNNMRPVMKVADREGDILLADSGEPFEARDDDGNLRRVYRTAFAIQRGKVWTASTNDYPEMDYFGISRRDSQQKRIDDCLIHARAQMADCLSVGLYDGQRRICEILH